MCVPMTIDIMIYFCYKMSASHNLPAAEHSYAGARAPGTSHVVRGAAKAPYRIATQLLAS